MPALHPIVPCPSPERWAAEISFPPPAMADLARYAPRPLCHLETDGEGLTLRWARGETGRVDALWLRDNCPCPACRHPQTMERRWLLIDAAPGLTLSSARLLPGGHLEACFSDGHVGRYDGGWLAAQLWDAEGLGIAGKRRLWQGGHRPGRVGHAAYMAANAGLGGFISLLLREGIAVLEEGPCSADEVLRVAERIGQPRSSNFGSVYDVVSRPNPNNSAYTADGLELHNDLINWRWPPDFQFLYCLANEASGGESLFADGFAVAEALRALDPLAFAVLAETPVAARFHDEGCDLRFAAPAIEIDADGALVAVRFNNWLRAALSATPERTRAWYAAYRQFWQLLRDPAYRIELKLAPGEMVAFDNRRVLHGRRAFDPQSGRRHLQGLYMNRDEMESRLRLLARED